MGKRKAKPVNQSAADESPESFTAFLARLEGKCGRAEAEYLEVRDEAKRLRRVVEEKVAALRAAVREGQLPLFDRDADGNSTNNDTGPGSTDRAG